MTDYKGMLNEPPQWVWSDRTSTSISNLPVITPQVNPVPNQDIHVLMQRLATLGFVMTPNVSLTVKKLTSGTRVVLLVNGDQWVTLEDGPELYPSDTLITAIGVVLK